MNARTLQEADAGTPLEVLPPVLFNTFKHHAGALRRRIAAIAADGPAALAEFGAHMAVLGTKLMDLYTGRLWPADLSARVLEQLRAAGRLELPAFRAWLAGQGNYGVIELAEDGSRWVLRLGDELGRYVHLHPGRWSPQTVRVRAPVLKTAFLVLGHVALHGGDPLDRVLINAVRREHLELPPLGKDPEGELGLGAIIELLRRGEDGLAGEGQR
jgi:hypothetical protein